MTPNNVARLRDLVQAEGLLEMGRSLVAMLSGGRDSVCLLDVAVGLEGAAAVRALHVNYGLRPEAEQEEAHCRALCHELGVELEVVRADEPPDVGNIQAWARALRYTAAARLAEPIDALIATGHTATDQVETILYRLAASPGRRALLGMSSAEGRLIRPLLGVTREHTAAYCEARGLTWCDDASNDSDRYARGRVRRGLVPSLREVHPAAEANVLRTARLLREETELLDSLVDAELAGESSIALERLAALPAALARMVVVRLAERAAGGTAGSAAGGTLEGTAGGTARGFVPQAGERVGEILALGARGGKAELHVGGLVSAVVQGGRLSMVAIEPHYTAPDER